jgi:hypothetical protein
MDGRYYSSSSSSRSVYSVFVSLLLPLHLPHHHLDSCFSRLLLLWLLLLLLLILLIFQLSSAFFVHCHVFEYIHAFWNWTPRRALVALTGMNGKQGPCLFANAVAAANSLAGALHEVQNTILYRGTVCRSTIIGSSDTTASGRCASVSSAHDGQW